MREWASLSHVRWERKYRVVMMSNYQRKALCVGAETPARQQAKEMQGFGLYGRLRERPGLRRGR